MNTALPPGLPDTAAVQSIPAYVLHTDCGRQTPFLIALLMLDQDGRHVLPPAAANAVNRTIDITGRNGMALATVLDGEPMDIVIRRTVPKALSLPGAFLLFRCQSIGTAENLMGHLLSSYRIELLKDRSEPI